MHKLRAAPRKRQRGTGPGGERCERSADGGNIALTAQNDTYTTAKWSGLLAAQDLSSIQVGDFEMIDGGARIALTLDCQRTPITQ